MLGRGGGKNYQLERMASRDMPARGGKGGLLTKYRKAKNLDNTNSRRNYKTAGVGQTIQGEKTNQFGGKLNADQDRLSGSQRAKTVQ